MSDHNHGAAPFAAPFDSQAGRFDQRAGLPPEAVQAIARALLGLAGPSSGGPGGHLLELGAGTGEIGAALVAAGARYAGLDLSLGMLGRARGRLAGRAFQADADRPWPVRAGSVHTLFASRAAHLFDLDRLVAEALRAARPDGLFVLGRVRRQPGSLRADLRRRMRRLLAERGFEARGGEAARDRLLEALAALGGAPRPPRVAASWPIAERAADSLAAWRGKPGLAGAPVPPELQREVLDALEAWAREAWGDLEKPRDAIESYELTAVALPPSPTAPTEETS
jgi:SAM-dependent methyltransferase